jgi:hypothetical protein
MYRKWMATIKEQEKDRLTPVSISVSGPYLSFIFIFEEISLCLTLLCQIVEALSNAYFGPDYSQVVFHIHASCTTYFL